MMPSEASSGYEHEGLETEWQRLCGAGNGMAVWQCRLGAARLVSDHCNVWEELFALQSHFCSGTEHQSPGQAQQEKGSGLLAAGLGQEQLPRSGLAPAGQRGEQSGLLPTPNLLHEQTASSSRLVNLSPRKK